MSFLDILRGFAGAAFALGFAIFIHELGHFMFAKLFGVKVETFSIGFGQKIWSRKYGETEYALSAIPLGGYVKMVGMFSKDMENLIHGEEAKITGAETTPAEDAAVAAVDAGKEPGAGPAAVVIPGAGLAAGVVDEMDALRNKAWWQKVLVLAGGCMNNVITAFVVFFIMGLVGVRGEAPQPAVIDAVEHMPPGLVDLRPGDRVVSVNGKQTSTGIDAMLASYDPDKPTSSTVLSVDLVRSGTTISVALPAKLDPAFPPSGMVIRKVNGRVVKTPLEAAREVSRAEGAARYGTSPTVTLVFAREGSPGTGAADTVTSAGVPVSVAYGPFWFSSLVSFRIPPFIQHVMPNLPAEQAGLRTGDIVLSVDGTLVDSSFQATSLIKANAGQAVDVRVKRTGRDGTGTGEKTLTVDVRESPETKGRGQVGLMFGAPLVSKPGLAPAKALAYAAGQTTGAMVKIPQSVYEIFARSKFQTIRENVGGPIAIMRTFFGAANLGWDWFFSLFAFFNINLAIFNMLPLLVLDGGHIVVATVEAIIRRPMPAKPMLYATNVFVVLLIGLAIAVTFNDLLMNAWLILGRNG